MQLLNRIFEIGRESVNWRATGLLILMRAISSSLVIGIVSLFTSEPKLFTWVFGGPIVGILFLIPMAMVGMVVGKVFPVAGFMSLPALVFMTVGDPLLWLLDKFRPDIVPVDKFSIFNFRAILLVINQDVVSEAAAGAKEAITAKATDAFDRLRNSSKK